MTSHRYAFLSAAIEAELQLTSSRLESLRTVGTSTFLEVFRLMHDDVANKFAATLGPATTKDAAADLQPLLNDARFNDALIAKYGPDTLRYDVPAGYRILVDAAVRSLHGDNIQHLLHVSDDPYAVRSMGKVPAIIIEVPAADPTNALLAPVLAHEVAHSVVGHLVSGLIGNPEDDNSAFSATARHLVTTPESRLVAHPWIEKWVEELLCDAVAVLMCGPSFLFALHSYASGRQWSTDDKHPPTQLRVRMALRMLTNLGWKGFLLERVPDVWEWSEEYIEFRAGESHGPLEFSLMLSEQLLPLIAECAGQVTEEPMCADVALQSVLDITEYFDQHLLPVDIETALSTEWGFVLGAWLSGIDRHGGKRPVTGLSKTARDKQLNSLLIKTIELSRVKKGWDDLDAPR